MAKNTVKQETEVTPNVETEKQETVKQETEKKVKIVVPKDNLNPKDDYVTVCINGNVTQIMRGVDVEVTDEQARILKDAGYLGY